MKQILKQLQKQRKKLVEAIEHRDDYYTNRSDEWKESASGVIYESKTQGFADVISILDESITEFNNLLNDC